MRKINFAICLIILLSFIMAFYFYSKVPSTIPSHWNIQGEVDSYMPKFWGLFLMPLISVALFLLFLAIPNIDPLKANIKKFMGYYDLFILSMMLFLFYIYLLTIFYTIGYRFNMSTAILPALAILFYMISLLLKNSKRNYFIGIRTPWTIQSEKVWNKTHKLGSKLFIALSIIILLSVFMASYGFYIVIVSILAVTLYLIYYSYMQYKK